jgi:hypothetical protein
MTALIPTKHAAIRMAQRCIPAHDAELIVAIGTEVGDGYLVRLSDVQAAESELKNLLSRIRRLEGKRLVAAEGRIVTAYHATHRQQRRLLRRAYESDLRLAEHQTR